MMRRKILNRKKANPFANIFTGIKYSDKIDVQLFKYNKDSIVEDTNLSEKKIETFSDFNYVYWLNIHGIHDADKINDLCNKFGIHNLAVQDILDVNQRPKFQEYEDYWFFSIKSILPSESNEVVSEQLSFILGKNFLISFQERKADYFEHIRHRLREKIGFLRERSSDYLLFLLLESILDNYFKSVNNIEQQVDEFGLMDINSDPSPEILNTIELYKRQLHLIKRTIIPINEFVTKIEREQFNMIDQKHIKYFYELKDLGLTVLDSCATIEMRLESTTNLFFSIQGHRMNQVMKTLTVVAAIFIPLTFVAGIYGMNFTNMPELSWRWGYPALWSVLVLISIGMIIYFKRKRWY
jgi:magnesium transporter